MSAAIFGELVAMLFPLAFWIEMLQHISTQIWSVVPLQIAILLWAEKLD